MEEIKIYLDKEKNKEAEGIIEFDGVVAGEISTGRIYVHNITKYYIDLEISLIGENIDITKTIKRLAPKQTKEVEFKFNPKITTMKPIRAKLKIKLEYTIS